MIMIARPATPGLFCDFSVFPSRIQAIQLRAAGFIGCFCYVGLPNNNDENDVTKERLLMLIDIGFEVGFVQHVRRPPWDPREHSGAEDGATAAERAQNAGAPQGVHIFPDWEGLVFGLPVAAAKTYLESSADRLLAARYRAGMYCGFDDPMSPRDRYYLHGITSYWSDESHRAVYLRGCAVTQGAEIEVDGVRIDNDTVQPDLLGETPWIATAA